MVSLHTLQSTFCDLPRFCERLSGLRLRSYQIGAANAITRSILQQQGASFVVLFPRQSGKNELQAQIEAYLLLLLSQEGAEIIKISPTWRPQSLNAMRRLERVLQRNVLTRSRWQKESGHIYRLGQARVIFLSGAPEANIVGATASTLLEVDEAQDVLISKFDKDIAPMAASTNATRVFWGTAWTSQTLLARELRAARQAEALGGSPRAFVLTADEVAQEVAAYGRFVAGQVARLGRSHPMIRTQYYCEEIDAEGGLFPAERRALMQGSHAGQSAPLPGALYALLIDVAGEDANRGDGQQPDAPLQHANRDSTAATLVQVDCATLRDPALQAPTYRVAARRVWTGLPHTRLYAQLRALAEGWQVRYVVIDATGVGAGLTSFLQRALGERVKPFLFNAASKSRLGWDFLSLCDSGRYQEAAPGSPADPLQERFWQEAAACAYQVLEGPGQMLRWGVPNNARHPHSGEPIHDDLLLSAALCAVLDGLDWSLSAPALLVRAPDILKDLDQGF